MQWRPDQIMIPLRHVKSVKSLQWLYGFWLFESFNGCNISYWLVVTSRRLLIWTCSSRCFPKSMICSCNWIAYSPDISKFFVKPQSFSARKPSQKNPKKPKEPQPFRFGRFWERHLWWLRERGRGQWFAWRRSQSWQMSALRFSTFFQWLSFSAVLLLPSRSPTNCAETTRPETYPWQDQRQASGDCAFRTDVRLYAHRFGNSFWSTFAVFKLVFCGRTWQQI